VLTSELQAEDFLFSAGGGFLFGAVAGYAIKKVMKLAAIVIGLFVAGLAYLSYRGWVDVKWAAMEDASRSTLTNASEQIVHALNNTAPHFEYMNKILLTIHSILAAVAHPTVLGKWEKVQETGKYIALWVVLVCMVMLGIHTEEVIC
jgi:uncharacterized membrane protein (Fun14 family)